MKNQKADIDLYRNMNFEEIEKITMLDHSRYEGLEEREIISLIGYDFDNIQEHYSDDDEGEEKYFRIRRNTWDKWHEKYCDNNEDITDTVLLAFRRFVKGI